MLYALARCIFVPFFKLFFRARVIGKENLPAEGPVILAANHLSNWDPPFLACFIPRHVHYMAKTELFENPIFSAMIRSCHAFPVKRGAADRGAIKMAMQVLKGGSVLGVFPEGTRSRTGEMGKAEAGGCPVCLHEQCSRCSGSHHRHERDVLEGEDLPAAFGDLWGAPEV